MGATAMCHLDPSYAVPDSMGYTRMRYDAQNRLVQRIVPPVVYQPLDAGLALRGFIYPGPIASPATPPSFSTTR